MRKRTLAERFVVVMIVSVWLPSAFAPAAADNAAPVYPAAEWATVPPADAGLDPAVLGRARDYALTGGGSGVVVRGGRVALAWGDQKKRYDLKSSTKSFGAIVLGLALADGKVALDDPAVKHQPALGVPPESNRATGWIEKVTLRHLATQTAGFEKPGGYGKLLFEPGTRWRYSDAGPNWLAECLTLAYHRDVADLMAERVFRPIGVGPDDLTWRANQYRDKQLDGVARREFGAGVSADVDAMARVGLLMLRGGRWNDRRLLPADFVARCGRPDPSVPKLSVDAGGEVEYAGAPGHYGLLWWDNADGALAGVPRDAYWSWGLYDSLIVVVPSLDVVAARAGQGWKREAGAKPYAVLAPFLEPVCGAVTKNGAAPATRQAASAAPAGHAIAAEGGAPLPPSPVIRRVAFDPPSTVTHQALDSDNWPMTWADDGHQYTAFGDGWGFQREPGERKLSLGIARVEGDPPTARGVDIPAPSIETTGGGNKAAKASGILCADGVLYLWLRNAGNSQLAWSADHGRTWERAGWRFTTSFGCPTFLNAGRNYADARDAFVYVYSFDAETAYLPADRMVMARVPKDRVRDRSAYAFFAGTDADGRPKWSADVADRSAVLSNPGKCYRSNVTYAPGLKRYLWVQTIPPTGNGAPAVNGDPPAKGGEEKKYGLAIYDAAEPWGPWTTAFYAAEWDVDAGDSAVLPAKWLSPDGTAATLVFAGGDSFATRGVHFERRADKQP